jgi:hypothetical protein
MARFHGAPYTAHRSWSTVSQPNGTYEIASTATYGNGESGTSAPITITVDNPPPIATVLVPADGATVSGTSQPISASTPPGLLDLTFEISGGTLTDQPVGISGPNSSDTTWTGQWNTTTVPDGTYTLQCVATYPPNGLSATGPGITITVAN